MASGLNLRNAVLESPLVTPPQPLPDHSDAALVRAAQEGHRDAFGQLYQRYARMVHGILLAKLPALEVEDMVHEVFLRALPRLHGLRQASRFGAWLGAITRNMAKDYYRRRSDSHIERGNDPAVEIPDPSTGHAEQAQAREAAEILESIRSLPEAYRETLILRLVEGMTGPEIAAKTGLSHGSVRVNLNRGTRQLREKLAQRGRAATSANPAK